MNELIDKVKMASRVDVSRWKGKKVTSRPQKSAIASHALAESTDKVVAIGASTGGTEALRKVVTQFPSTMPGVAIWSFSRRRTKSRSASVRQTCTAERPWEDQGSRLVERRS